MIEIKNFAGYYVNFTMRKGNRQVILREIAPACLQQGRPAGADQPLLQPYNRLPLR